MSYNYKKITKIKDRDIYHRDPALDQSRLNNLSKLPMYQNSSINFPPPKFKPEMNAPSHEFTPENFEKLCTTFYTLEEITSYFGYSSVNILREKCFEVFKKPLEIIYHQFVQEETFRLRRALFQKALSGSVIAIELTLRKAPVTQYNYMKDGKPDRGKFLWDMVENYNIDHDDRMKAYDRYIEYLQEKKQEERDNVPDAESVPNKDDNDDSTTTDQ